MPSVTYSGSFGTVNAGSNGLSIPVTGASIPSGMTITGITFTLGVSAGKYSSSENWVLHWFAIGSSSGSPSAGYKTAAMYDSEHTFSGKMSYSQSDLSKFTSGSFTLYAKANCTHDTTSYMEDFTITVEYGEYSECEAPTTCELSSTLSNENVTLSWSGAKAGTGNAITGYIVQRCESSDGSTWGSWSALETVSTTATSGSLSVAPPETAGNYYKYRVQTKGAAGSAYYSGYKESSNTLRRDHGVLEGFTDAMLTAEATPVKALHMQELQDRVATLRAFYGLSAYSFTNIVAGQTSLAGWTAHVLEIREAIDELGKTHDAWLTITENKPRADVVQQLRDVVLSL